jgi:hypothetical protein
MRKLFSISILALSLVSCSKSPESAAADVCDCYKSLGDVKMGEVLAETKKCTQLMEKYSSNLKGEDLKTFSLGIANCTTKGLFK